MAQRCAAVAAGQTQPPKAAQGRADLRAAQHSGGRPKIKGGRGPQKKKNFVQLLALKSRESLHKRT